MPHVRLGLEWQCQGQQTAWRLVTLRPPWAGPSFGVGPKSLCPTPLAAVNPDWVTAMF